MQIWMCHDLESFKKRLIALEKKAAEEKRLADEKKAAAEKRLAEEKKAAEQKRLAEARQQEEQQRKAAEEQKKLDDQRKADEIHEEVQMKLSGQQVTTQPAPPPTAQPIGEGPEAKPLILYGKTA